MNKQILFMVVLIALGLWTAYLLVPSYGEYLNTRHGLAEIQGRVLDGQSRNEQLRAEIHQLRTDTRAVERIAREKFGWVLPNETIYDFGEPRGATPVRP